MQVSFTSISNWVENPELLSPQNYLYSSTMSNYKDRNSNLVNYIDDYSDTPEYRQDLALYHEEQDALDRKFPPPDTLPKDAIDEYEEYLAKQLGLADEPKTISYTKLPPTPKDLIVIDNSFIPKEDPKSVAGMYQRARELAAKKKAKEEQEAKEQFEKDELDFFAQFPPVPDKPEIPNSVIDIEQSKEQANHIKKSMCLESFEITTDQFEKQRLQKQLHIINSQSHLNPNLKKQNSILDEFFYKEVKTVEEPIKILWQTILLFNQKNAPHQFYNVFFATKFIKNNITAEKVQKFLKTNLNIKISIHTCNEYLKELDKDDFIDKCDCGYNLRTERETTELMSMLNDIKLNFRGLNNFESSHFKIFPSTLKNFTKGKYKSVKYFLNEELICRLWWDCPVSKHEIAQTLSISHGTVSAIVDSFHGIKTPKIQFWNDETQGFKQSMPITVGCIYDKDIYPTKCKISKSVKSYIEFCDSTYFNTISEENLSAKERVVFVKRLWKFAHETRGEMAGLRNSARQIKRGANYTTFSSLWKQNNHYTPLAENSFVYCHLK